MARCALLQGINGNRVRNPTLSRTPNPLFEEPKMAIQNINSARVDTRLPAALHPDAVLHLFPEGTRTDPDAVMLSTSIANVRDRLQALFDAVDSIAADKTLTVEAQLMQAVALAERVRAGVTDSFGRLRTSLRTLRATLETGFESDLEKTDIGHGLTTADMLTTARIALERIGGSPDMAIRQFAQSAIDARDGKMLRVIYKQPGYLLGVSDDGMAAIREHIAESWSRPYVERRAAYDRVSDYLGRAAEAADQAARPDPHDATVAGAAARAKANREKALAGIAEGGA